jgi:L-cysteine desulfidase
LSSGEGVVGQDIEKTIKNIGILSQIGMDGTDETILGIMTNKY